jgi:hypothetical protein
MKIGDKVRFLNEVGEGRITGFQGKNIVLVEDQDGFEMPMLINEVVVINSDDYSITNVIGKSVDKKEIKNKREGASFKYLMSNTNDISEGEDIEPADKEITFKVPVKERKGGSRLSSYLAFVPVDSKNITSTNLECYMINDSNYYLRYSLLSAEGNSWTQEYEGELEPNTKAFIKEVEREELNDMQHVAIQMFAYKRDKPFLLKPAIDVQLRIDPVKFYKLHSFVTNVFFEQPALLFTIIENDEMQRPLLIDSKKLKQEMYAKQNMEDSHKRKTEKKDNNSVVVVDLHASELLDTTAGMSNADILKYQIKKFTETLSEYANKKGQKIIFIHGKGEGVLRNAILHELNYKYKRYHYQDASFREYGYGATQVTIR